MPEFVALVLKTQLKKKKEKKIQINLMNCTSNYELMQIMYATLLKLEEFQENI